ncbi:MAG: hypothetical protein OEV66_04520 [Spirochaetia bacterium]|nr:hypothetical protein [Spirochaetia bacterium]
MKVLSPFIFLITIVLSCQRNDQIVTNKIESSTSATNITVTGLNPGEKITAVSATGQPIDISNDGKVTLSGTDFIAEVSNASQISNQPAGKKCSFVPANSDGQNITWNIVCDYIKYFALNGQVSGLAGSGLSIQLNQYIPIQINSNGKFQLSAALPENTPYEVTVKHQPESPNQNCAIYNRKGILVSDQSDIQIVCAYSVFLLSGYIQGQKSGFTIETSTGESMRIGAHESTFSFNEFIPANGSYLVSVKDQPYGQECYVLNARGGKVQNNISNIQIVCGNLTTLQISLLFPDNILFDKNNPARLHVWFYVDRDQIVYPEIKKEIYFSPDKKEYSFRVPQGQYFIRAFLDVNSNGLPDIGSDYQSRLYGPWGSTNDNISLELEDTSADSRFGAFNAYMFSSASWNQPGGGKCGGIYMRMEADRFTGNKNHISPVYVILPDYQTIELLDDGGCGNAFNNNASSYDRQSGDMQLSTGFDSTNGVSTGDYVFFYQNYVSGKIQVYKDAISTVAPLSSMIYLTNPSGAFAEKNESPVFQWSPVAGAGSYEILVESTDHLLNNYADPYRLVNRNFYALPFPLVDQKSYKVNIQAFDSDVTSANPNFNAVSQSPDNYFITDFTGNNSAGINGKLINKSGASGSFIIYGDSNTQKDGWEASIFLAPEVRDYSLTVFKNSGKYGALISGINIDSSGYIFSELNRAYASWRIPLLLTASTTLDLTWNQPLLLTGPPNNIRGTGSYPEFSWEDYSAFVSRGTSYILWLTPHNSRGFPVIIGLKNNTFDFRHAEISPYLNLGSIYECTLNANNSQSYSNCEITPENTSPDLKDQPQWDWKVMVIACDFESYSNFTDENKNGINDYTDCILKTFNGENPPITESVSRLFSTY